MPSAKVCKTTITHSLKQSGQTKFPRDFATSQRKTAVVIIAQLVINTQSFTVNQHKFTERSIKWATDHRRE